MECSRTPRFLWVYQSRSLNLHLYPSASISTFYCLCLFLESSGMRMNSLFWSQSKCCFACRFYFCVRNAYACIVAAALSYMVSFCFYFDFLFVFNHCLRDAAERTTKAEQLYSSRLEKLRFDTNGKAIDGCAFDVRCGNGLKMCEFRKLSTRDLCSLCNVACTLTSHIEARIQCRLPFCVLYGIDGAKWCTSEGDMEQRDTFHYANGSRTQKMTLN